MDFGLAAATGASKVARTVITDQLSDYIAVLRLNSVFQSTIRWR